MKIKSITIKNFKSIGNAPFTYNFDSNFSLIKGSPGKGKTLILTAIAFNLFGKNTDFKGNSNSTLPANKLINDINNKELMTEIVLDNGYTIRRGLKPNVFEVLNEKGLNVNDLSSKKLDQEMLEQDILKGLDLNLFMTTNYLCSKPSSVPFLYMSKTQRKEYIEKMLDLRIVYHLNENLKPYIAENKLDKSKLENEQSLLNQTIENEVFNVQQAQKRLSEDKIKLDNFEVDKKKRLDNIEVQNISYSKAINEKQQQLNYIEGDIDITKDKLVAHDVDSYPILSSSKIEKEKLKQKLKDEIVKRKAEKDAFDKNKENYSFCGQCPTLSKIVGSFNVENYNTFQLKSAEAFNKIDSEIKEIVKKLDYQETIRNSNSEVEREIQKLNTQLREVEAELSIIANKVESNNKLKESIEREEPPKLTVVSTEYLQKLQNDKKDLEQRIDTNYNNNIDLDKMKKEINDKEHKAKALQSYLPLFEKKLNELLDKFLVNMEFSIKAKLEDDFELTFYKNNKVVDIFGLSGGQKQLLTLSVTFSFLYLLELKHQNSFNHLFIDEILDMSLGVELPVVLDYLKELSQHKCIDLISHNTSINEEIFDKIVVVEKQDGFSKYEIN